MFYPVATNPVESVPATVLFYGSFLNLQGPLTIVQAARQYQGPPVNWTMVGEGPLLAECREAAGEMENVLFLPWVPYQELPEIIQRADILLGVFGTSAKAGRVIPNKVYQALACGKPLLTRSAPAYPASFHNNAGLGISWVKPDNPPQLAKQVAELLSDRHKLRIIGTMARKTYETHFSTASISAKLMAALKPLLAESGK